MKEETNITEHNRLVAEAFRKYFNEEITRVDKREGKITFDDVPLFSEKRRRI